MHLIWIAFADEKDAIASIRLAQTDDTTRRVTQRNHNTIVLCSETPWDWERLTHPMLCLSIAMAGGSPGQIVPFLQNASEIHRHSYITRLQTRIEQQGDVVFDSTPPTAS